MKKSLLVASVLALFASMSFAQASAPMGEAAAASAPAKHKKHHKAQHKKHHKAKAASAPASN
jgi:hypothetical protein